ncbi:MAG: DUF4349 domain-containing protein [Treponema sp.]|jgi:hypothetical protein|nr:DUF4349 domain-containing protein [Treponema sp.]
MGKNIQKIIFLTVFSFIMLSCASSDSAPNKMASALSYESGEFSQRSRSENDDRMITYSISLELSVKNTDETKEILVEQVKNNKGFIVKETENYITTRIPTENMENFINNAKALGKIESETKTGTDITDQYRDNVIRLENLKNVHDRYLALLEKANTVTDILSIEKELERVNMEIEILEGRIKYAELSVTYSNITVRFREKVKPGPVGWIFYGLYRGIKWLFVWN